MSAGSRLEDQLVRTAHRLASQNMRQLLRDRRRMIQERAAARKAAHRRRLALGTAVARAGMQGWESEELIGLLLDGKTRVGTSTTQRLGLKKLGQAHATTGEPQKAEPPHPVPRTRLVGPGTNDGSLSPTQGTVDP